MIECQPLYHSCYVIKPNSNNCDLIVLCSLFIMLYVTQCACLLYPCCRFNGLMQLVFGFMFHLLTVSWKSPGNLLGWICRHPDLSPYFVDSDVKVKDLILDWELKNFDLNFKDLIWCRVQLSNKI